MDNLSLAVEAKRQKEFKLALYYYEKELEKVGPTVELLRSIGKVLYLKGEREKAVSYYLAEAHLYLSTIIEKYVQGDPVTKTRLQKLPSRIGKPFPHPIGALLLSDSYKPRNIAHAVYDVDVVFRKKPEFKTHAEIYQAHILDDGSLQGKLEKYNLTIEDQQDFETRELRNLGHSLLINRLNWPQIRKTNVMNLYFNK